MDITGSSILASDTVLIVRFSSIGDIVLTSPIVRCIYNQLRCKIHFIAKRSYAELVQHSPYIEKVFTFDNDWTEVQDKLKDENYKCIIDLHKNLRSKRLIRFLNRPSLDFYKANIEKWLRVHTPIDLLPHTHLVDRYFDSMPVENDGAGVEVFVPNEALPTFEKTYSHILSQPYIVIALGATHYTKRIPHDILTSVISRIDYPCMLIGGSDVEHEGALLSSSYDHVHNAIGKTSILESTLFIRRASAMITGDTGMMHIGASTDTPMIVVWGSTIPAFGMYPYYGQQPDLSTYIEVDGLRCRPCSKLGKSQCPKSHFRCMNEIQVDEIIEGLSAYISTSS